MPIRYQLSLPANIKPDEVALKRALSKKIEIGPDRINQVVIRKRSIDARRKKVVFVYAVDAWIDETYTAENSFKPKFQNVANQKEVVIVGAGPAGYFAALKLIEKGLKPVIFERGKDIKERRRDLAQLTKEHLVNPDSNYCFGEGGAGTYSDGKLYTRSDKRGDVGSVLDMFIFMGADPDIKVNSRPHIGTNKLPGIIEKMRECILSHGGEVHFNSTMTGLEVKHEKLVSVTINSQKVLTQNLILATGHSSRTIYELLLQNKLSIEAKPIAMGVRVEHPQQLIDSIQYHCKQRPDYLPPAYYNLTAQIEAKGVYSFCMCPGGIIAPCSTSSGEVVTNGWSPSKRNNPFANSGIVVEINMDDISKDYNTDDPLRVMKMQQEIEKLSCLLAGGNQTAPAQRLVDFVENKVSNNLPDCSYLPGITSVDLKEIFSKNLIEKLQKGFRSFGEKMNGYFTNEAVLVAPESRTSAPVKIPRNPKSLQHIDAEGLFPCGEGAGYAGGIVSAAIDGIRCADKISK